MRKLNEADDLFLRSSNTNERTAADTAAKYQLYQGKKNYTNGEDVENKENNLMQTT